MEATVDPQSRGPDWMPITPKTGSLFHADSHVREETGLPRGDRGNPLTADSPPPMTLDRKSMANKNSSRSLNIYGGAKGHAFAAIAAHAGGDSGKRKAFMTDTDKIVAAILAAGKCGVGANHDSDTHLQTYDEFREKIATRETGKHEVAIEFLRKLTGWRNDALTIKFDLLKLITEKDSRIRVNPRHNAIAQLLVGASFSLWRAVFLTDMPLELDDALTAAKGFLEKVVSDNAIGFSDEKKFKRWTAGFYVSHIEYRLYHLQHEYSDILAIEELRNFADRRNPFSSAPGTHSQDQLISDAIGCLKQLIIRFGQVLA